MSVDSSSRNAGEGALIINDEEVRIVLVGKTGAGKSTTGNTILGSEAFESIALVESLTTKCKKVGGVLAGRNVSVVDTPDLFYSKISEDKTLDEIKQCISYAAPGPHVFLIVIKLGGFTDVEKKSVETIQKVFGEMSNEYSMILFTHGDQDETAEEMLNDSPELRELICKCEGRYHVFNNKTKDPSQVTELLEKINEMLKKNGGSHYTNDMFQDVEKEIEEEKERILQQMQRLEEEAREEAERRNAFIGDGIHSEATPLVDSDTQCDGWQEALVVMRVAGVTGAIIGGGVAAGATGQRSEQDAGERSERLKRFIKYGTDLGRAVGRLAGEEGAEAGGAIGAGVGALAHFTMTKFE